MQSTPINYQKSHCKSVTTAIVKNDCLHFSHIRLSMEHRYNNHSFQIIGLWVCVTGDITAQRACPLASLNRI